jgi:hypothetical protein
LIFAEYVEALSQQGGIRGFKHQESKENTSILLL